MPGLPSWISGQPASAPVSGTAAVVQVPYPYYPRQKDPNAPDHRLQLSSRCVYERRLPGGSYITAHVERLQSGYYDSPEIHEDCINNVRFVAIRFVMHEASTERRFKSATIRISLRDGDLVHGNVLPLPPQLEHPANQTPLQQPARLKPKFLRHAPHLLYGAMSPETLDWNFNLAGSLGVAQTPVSASINPSYGLKSSYKLYKMMKIQGSIRTNPSWLGQNDEIEDGEIVWTMEENSLQRSGLPREFTFVMMLTKGDDANNVLFHIEVEPEVASWFGHYPQWWNHFLKYQPLFKEPLDLDKEMGQKFEPCAPHIGFNFAGLMSTFDDFVTLPGTLYANHEFSGDAGASNSQAKQSTGASGSGDPANPNNTLHLRIHLDQTGKQASSLSADAPSSSLATRPQQTSQAQAPSSRNAAAGPSSKRSPKLDSSNRSEPTQSTKASRRFTLNGGLTPTPPKHKSLRITPLQTHYEEPTQTESRPKSSPEADVEGATRAEAGQEADNEYIFSFPEVIATPSKLPPQTARSSSTHRHSKSVSTTASSAPTLNKVMSAPVSSPGPAAGNAPLTYHHSLRRNRSRSDLRRASLVSTPEDEEAIAAAVDMMSGSPPPPAPAPPRSAPAALIPSEDTVLATPRTRATLADLLEVERAENARVARRNGTLKVPAYESNQGEHTVRRQEPVHITSRSRERERSREKRYSMPVTSTGIGYPSSAGNLDDRDANSAGPGITNGVGRNGDSGTVTGNGRSSLMIPVGRRRHGGALD